jgi:glutathionyl-hydroquinone reductase
VSPRMGPSGWAFSIADDFPGAEKDPYNNAHHMKDIYFKVDPEYKGRFTVPVLWDNKEQTIVNNESSEIIRMFNSEFDQVVNKSTPDLYPLELRSEIDEINDWVYSTVNSEIFILKVELSPDSV